MAVLEIKKYPEKILRVKCRFVERITEKEKNLMQQMLLTMRQFNGVGLAAPQIGVDAQIIVADIGEGAVALANPKIVAKRGTDVLEEGCLSVPEARVNVLRHYEIVVTGINDQDETREIAVKGLMARVLQHEIDHLEGKLIIDYFPWWEKIGFELQRRR